MIGAKEMIMHLRCLRCGEAFSMSQDAMAQVGYTKYSYCEKCLRLGLNKLRGAGQDEYLIDIKKELAARLKPLDGFDEKEIAYKTGWNDAIMALIENRPIETNGDKGG